MVLLDVKLFVSTLAICVLNRLFLGIVLESQSMYVSTSMLFLKSFPFWWNWAWSCWPVCHHVCSVCHV